MQLRRLAAALVFLIPATTWAQGVGAQGGGFTAGGVVSGPGVLVGEDSVLHPYAGTEVGFVSNVFYEDADANPSGLLHLIAGIDWLPASSDEERGGSPDGKTVSATAGFQLRYQEYLSGNQIVQSQRALGGDAHVRLDLVPGQTWNGFFSDAYVRSYRSPNFETSDNLLRDINRFQAGLQWRPQGNTLSGQLIYQNVVDVFEDDPVSDFANRIQHQLKLRVNWQWLPVTRFYFQASQGFYSGLGTNELGGQKYKQSSFPLDLRIGADTAITELTSIRAFFGWGFGFYEAGPSYTSPTFGVDLGWQYSPLGKMLLGFQRRFDDSINANYYADWAVRLTINQQVGRFLVNTSAQYIRRRYEGISPSISTMSSVRDDNIFNVGAEARYYAWERLAFTASYDFTLDDTAFRTMAGASTDDPSYVRHQVLGGVYAAF